MDTVEKTSSMREDRERGERTKHATLARQTAGGQRRLRVVVTVVCADVVPKVGGATGHPEGWGTEEARAERACVEEEPWECGGRGEGMGEVEVWRVRIFFKLHTKWCGRRVCLCFGKNEFTCMNNPVNTKEKKSCTDIYYIDLIKFIIEGKKYLDDMQAASCKVFQNSDSVCKTLVWVMCAHAQNTWVFYTTVTIAYQAGREWKWVSDFCCTQNKLILILVRQIQFPKTLNEYFI